MRNVGLTLLLTLLYALLLAAGSWLASSCGAARGYHEPYTATTTTHDITNTLTRDTTITHYQLIRDTDKTVREIVTLQIEARHSHETANRERSDTITTPTDNHKADATTAKDKHANNTLQIFHWIILTAALAAAMAALAVNKRRA